ncbi:glycine--tRNA ligase subunit beta [Niallia endozanthoxylica]|uniref:Glycine--tRNA ligase beta subunit n=1 Tax=Niallia endozanthoxylica TaxID=2036016 RepID=A0A5J5HZC7_9BACI|nr:glycine--tRNA ligase subunit beta [Niallia endozanthoxylica]KAA9026342.1 glycine--tRNA ligase subunit beta [Niallia endozanthoxylica]
MAKDILLEIGLEELPARFVTNSMNQLADKVKTWLEAKQIQYGELQAYSTPRRLSILVKGVAEAQADIHEEAKGPAKKNAQNEAGEWTKAAIGFSRGQGMAVEDIYFKEINGVEYAHVKKFVKGQETFTLLPELKEIIMSLTFPKNMRWADNDLRYIRPIKWIAALFGQEVIPFVITNVETSRHSKGHRFLGGEIEFVEPADYEKVMAEQYVIVDPLKRKQTILEQLQKLEEEKGWEIPVDQDLLEEVNNLVEFPTALYGNFEEEFLELPQEVLITSMKEHQRYFPVKSKTGELLPHFVTVRNGGADFLENVARGNEKVLRARLSDAAFFYREDQKMEIDHALNKLKSIVYHEEIGTLSEKTARVQRLTNILSGKLDFSAEQKENANRAAEICKFDLVTNMVYEFPELQGFMGEKYARQKGEAEAVSIAINEHYMPRNAEDSVPSTEVGAILSIAEKVDTISSFFAIGLIPSGSQDPYALRRQATGVVQILLHKNWQIELEDILSQSLSLLESDGVLKEGLESTKQELLSFFKLRLKHLLQEKGIRYDLIDAVLGNDIGVVSSLITRALVLEEKRTEAEFKENMEALSRVLNIASKAEEISEIQESLFENNDEHKLFEKYQAVKAKLDRNITESEYFDLLVSLKPEINQYFDHTMIMADDAAVKQNRLSQMAKLSILIKKFANVNEIIVK